MKTIYTLLFMCFAFLNSCQKPSQPEFTSSEGASGNNSSSSLAALSLFSSSCLHPLMCQSSSNPASGSQTSSSSQLQNLPDINATPIADYCETPNDMEAPIILSMNTEEIINSSGKPVKEYTDFNRNHVYFVDSLRSGDSIKLKFQIQASGLYRVKLPHISVMGNTIESWLDLSYRIDDHLEKTFDRIDGRGAGQEYFMFGTPDFNPCDSCYIWKIAVGQSYLNSGSHTLTLSTQSGKISIGNPILQFLSSTTNCSNPWTLVWADEFEGTTINRNNWTHQLGDGAYYGSAGWGNTENQVYTEDPENSYLKDGNLVIEMFYNPRHELIDPLKVNPKYTHIPKCPDCHYTSARLVTEKKHSFQYGRIETRIKLPRGQGLWPALWMLAENSDWPRTGEIDIMEYRGDKTSRLFTTLHYGDGWQEGQHMLDGVENDLEYKLYNEYTEIIFEWNPWDVKWFVNGKLWSWESKYPTTYHPKPNQNITWPWDRPYYLIVNMATYGGFTGWLTPISDEIDPTFTVEKERDMRFYVDYIRVFQKE